MYLLFLLALGLLIQGFAWGFVDSGVMVGFLGNNCHLVACVTIFFQCPMQYAKLHAVFFEAHNFTS